jgi:hypothetical protein
MTDLEPMFKDAEYEAAMLEAEQEAQYLEEYYSEVEKHNDDFRKKWPNHCTKCGGWGMHEFVEMHGFNHGCGEHMADPCECTEEGKCARCGKENALGEECEGPCKFCGWNYDDGLAQG